MARYLVTGGAGFIGSHLTNRLLAAGHAVSVIDNLSTAAPATLSEHVKLLVGDAADQNAIAKAISEVDGIFHLVAISSVQRSSEDWLGSHRANQTASVTVLDAARARGRIPVVLASSAAVYGDNDNLPLEEGAAPRPLSAYAADKLASEFHARVAWGVHRVPTAALRFFNVFGPGQNPRSPYSGVISHFADRLINGRPPILHGDGQQTRDFIYVGDVVRHLEAAMASLQARPRHILCNVCTGHAITIEGLARQMGALIGRPDIALGFGPTRAGDVRHSRGSTSICEQELQIRAEVTLQDGLNRLLHSMHAVAE